MDELERTQQRLDAEAALARREQEAAAADSGRRMDHCADCGAEMIPVRKNYGFTLCVACQTRQERLAEQYRRARKW